MSMNERTILLELLLGGFFAVACIRAGAPGASENRLHFGNFLRLPGRLERLQRSRWQWASMMLLLVALRAQQQLPPVPELMAALEFLLFIALPSSASSAWRAEEEK
jgi:hypothetical protein